MQDESNEEPPSYTSVTRPTAILSSPHPEPKSTVYACLLCLRVVIDYERHGVEKSISWSDLKEGLECFRKPSVSFQTLSYSLKYLATMEFLRPSAKLAACSHRSLIGASSPRWFSNSCSMSKRPCSAAPSSAVLPFFFAPRARTSAPS